LFVQVAGFARQARPQSRPRYFWTHSEAKVRLCCPHLNPLNKGDPSHSLAALAEPRSSRSDSGPPRCSAWSRAGHPRREASGSGGGRGDFNEHLISFNELLVLTFSLQKCQSEVGVNDGTPDRQKNDTMRDDLPWHFWSKNFTIPCFCIAYKIILE
jgi:hypothetical protein